MKTMITAFIILFSTQTFAIDLYCPEKIETYQSLAKSVVGWSEGSIYEAQKRYDHFQVFGGHPKDNAILRPDGEDGKGFWTYDSKHGLWMQCRYRNTTVTLEKEIPNNVKKCMLKTDKNKINYLKCI